MQQIMNDSTSDTSQEANRGKKAVSFNLGSNKDLLNDKCVGKRKLRTSRSSNQEPTEEAICNKISQAVDINHKKEHTGCRLYVKLRKSIEKTVRSENELKSIHRDVINIKLPRRGMKAKFFYAVFKTEQKALKALGEMRKTGKYFVCQDKETNLACKMERKKGLKSSRKALNEMWLV